MSMYLFMYVIKIIDHIEFHMLVIEKTEHEAICKLRPKIKHSYIDIETT